MAIPLTNFHFGPRRVLVPSWLFRSGLHLVFLIKYGSTVVGVEGIDIDSGRSFSRLHNMHAHRLRSGPSDVAIVEDVLPSLCQSNVYSIELMGRFVQALPILWLQALDKTLHNNENDVSYVHDLIHNGGPDKPQRRGTTGGGLPLNLSLLTSVMTLFTTRRERLRGSIVRWALGFGLNTLSSLMNMDMQQQVIMTFL
ncbi:hypothetical protein J3459_013810 [Metarhizium acridum]|nr:hypothetical protein J3459_013810 [Metarhizium acridum]